MLELSVCACGTGLIEMKRPQKMLDAISEAVYNFVTANDYPHKYSIRDRMSMAVMRGHLYAPRSASSCPGG